MEVTYKENQIAEVAEQLITKVPSKILCIHGAMGAGKTTLIKAIMKNLGAIGEANSPTFGIVNEYHDQHDQVLAYHFDFYRLNDENEAFDMGIEDYFNTDVWIFMEWAENIRSIIPYDATEITIKVVNDSTRTLILHEKT